MTCTWSWQIPNIWYEAHLTAGDFDVAGVTLPGMPYVIVGHNQRIAWGFTNLGPNVEDLYVEKFNDQGQYLTPQGWVQPQHRQEIIRVKGKPGGHARRGDHASRAHHQRRYSRRDAQARAEVDGLTIRRPRAFRSSPSIQRRTGRSSRRRFRSSERPAQNVVYADVDGHIGYQATGLIPIRASGDGSMPVPGEDDAHEWTGYVPFDKLPSVYDPPSGIIATANGRITPDGLSLPAQHRVDVALSHPAPLQAAGRAEEVYARRHAGHPDRHRLAVRSLLRRALCLFDRPHAEGLEAREGGGGAHAELGWHDGCGFAAATIAVYSRDKLKEMLLQAKLGDDWTDTTLVS